MKEFLNKPDLGLLFIRAAIGALMFGLGVKAFMNGEQSLHFMGKQMAQIGITSYPLFWGALAALTFTLGGLLFLLGALFRYAAFMLFFCMLIAVLYHFSNGDDFFQATGYSFTLASIFLGTLFTGPGRFSLSKGA